MPIDDLYAPLGLGQKRQPARRPVHAYLAMAGLLGMTLAAFAIWRSAGHQPPPQPAAGEFPATRKPTAAPVPKNFAASLPAPPPKLPVGSTAPSADADTSAPADVITVEKERELAREANADPPQAGPGERIITIIDGRSGARQYIRIPATSVPVSPPDRR
jgi:hypothetical protein